MHRSPAILITMMLLFACYFSSSAQTSADTLSFSLDTLVVDAAPVSISRVDAPLALSISSRSEKEIASSASLSLSSITQNVPGIWVNNRHNYALGARITIRGLGWRAAFGVRGIQLILDGIPLTVADGQSITNLIDPAFVQKIELLRGPAASYWGNSSGGVLYLSTKPDYHDEQSFYLRTQAGSFGNRKEEIKFDQSFGKHNISGYTSYQFEDGYRDYSTSKLLRSGLQGSYQLSDKSHLEYTGALLYMPEAQHPSGLTAGQISDDPSQANSSYIAANAGKQITQGNLGFSYLQETSAGLLTLTGYGVYRDLANPLPFGIITVNRFAGGFRSTLEKKFHNLRLQGGAELKLQHDNREEFENNGGKRGDITVNQIEKVRNEALFATASYKLGHIKLLGGLRYDRITFASDSASNINTGDRSFHALSPSIALSYKAGTQVLFTNLSTAFEAPTTTELVNRPDGGNGFNPNLKPERTVGLEAGSRGSILKGLIIYDIAFYQLWIHDLLFPYQLQDNGAVFYRNQGETRHSGVEFSTTITPGKQTSFHFAYTLTRAHFKKAQTLDGLSLRNKNIPGVAKNRLSGAFSWSPAPFWFQVSSQYVSSYAVNNANTAFNDAYIPVDAKISYRKMFGRSNTRITPFININNIFDAQYNSSAVVNASGGRYFEPAPGRNWQAGVSVTF